MRKVTKKRLKACEFFDFLLSLQRKRFLMHIINNSTQYHKELKERILNVAMLEFKLKGIKAVKMDDIASLLSISKRTLYEIYNNKEDLLLEGLRAEENNQTNFMHDFANDKEHSVMDILITFYHIKMEGFSHVNPLFFSELHKYKGVISFLEHRHADNDIKAQEFFERGIEEGFFRDDFNYSIISNISNFAMSHIMETQMYKYYDLQFIFKNVVFLFIRGFCTTKGIEIVDRLLDK